MTACTGRISGWRDGAPGGSGVFQAERLGHQAARPITGFAQRSIKRHGFPVGIRPVQDLLRGNPVLGCILRMDRGLAAPIIHWYDSGGHSRLRLNGQLSRGRLRRSNRWRRNRLGCCHRWECQHGRASIGHPLAFADRLLRPHVCEQVIDTWRDHHFLRRSGYRSCRAAWAFGERGGHDRHPGAWRRNLGACTEREKERDRDRQSAAAGPFWDKQGSECGQAQRGVSSAAGGPRSCRAAV